MKSWTEIVKTYSFFQKTFILRRPGVTIFAQIIKIVTMFTKTILKIQENLDELGSAYLNRTFIQQNSKDVSVIDVIF